LKRLLNNNNMLIYHPKKVTCRKNTNNFLILIIMLFMSNLLHGQAKTKMDYWETLRKGSNCMNVEPTEKWFADAAQFGIEWVRLAYDKWQTDETDFLMGDASNYHGLVKSDLAKLKLVLSWADKYKLKVVLVPLSLPGRRWTQRNNNQYDARLWHDFRYHQMAADFWSDLAEELKDFSCIVAYNIINEPCPELNTGIAEQTRPGDAERFLDWNRKYKNTPRDLYKFYEKVISAIRTNDKNTPIMVEPGFYAQPPAYSGWPSQLSDPKVLYSFHMYEPYSFTSVHNFRNGGNFTYPGKIKFGGYDIMWDKTTLEKYFEQFEKWTKHYGIASSRIVAAEFGCMRLNQGAAQYLDDLINFFEERKFHWAFYSFREDGWDGYDYELGTQRLPASYWQAKEQGLNPMLPRKDNPLFNVIQSRLVQQ
jgi:hypothetical protein